MAPTPAGRTSPQQIANRIVDAILAGRIAPGQRLVEQSLADVFGVSRTLIREAMARLSARGMVEVNARRGWFVVQPSRDEAHEAFAARIAVETGILNALAAPLAKGPLTRLKQHVKAEQAAICGEDAGQRSYLLGDFHVCMAECLGGALLADILRDLTARTTLISTLFQSHQDAAQSCAEHAQIVAALESGDRVQAIALLKKHIQAVANSLGTPTVQDDPLMRLRTALEPPTAAAAAAAPRKRLFSDLVAAGRARPADASGAVPTARSTTRRSRAH